ncbi:unnamed protein product [Nippostrongylus brasiliensis]|uniref:Autophagy-related protein 2 n=1 Tax=Nippostrongylus brasiliensis TaxID=27835 RepID=A0A158QY52_NIPBR|nr:unnamed protein product [Nippostrongylus brasiliensis]
MKLSDFNITDGVHTRWCRFIIQRYLGQFLEQNLTLDQLSVSLIAGELSINDVKINAHVSSLEFNYVNEILTSMNLPLRLTDGFVGEIAIEVPWCALTSHASKMKVKQLDLTFQSREGVKLDNKDLVSSMIGSVVESLVSSSELAKSFFDNEKESGKEEEFDTEGKDGVMAFAKVIDAIVSRFCLELVDTTIRLENPPKALSDMCTAIEIRLKEVRFMDEQMVHCQQEEISNADQSRIDISGTFYLSSFIINCQFSVVLFELIPTAVNTPDSMGQSSGEPFRITRVDSERKLMSSPVKFAEFVGESRLIFRIKNSDAVVDKKGNKVEIESFFTGLHCFILPSQIEILKRFFASVSLPQVAKLNDFGKKMEKSDYDAMAKNIEEESFQKARLTTLGMQGTWSRRDDFREFDSINLEDNRSSRKLSETCRENYNTLKLDSSKKESTLLLARFGSVLICIPHNDTMSAESSKSFSNGFHEAIDRCIEEAEGYLEKASRISLKPTNLHNARNMLDKLYNKDHLRIVGTSVVLNYQMDKSGTGEQTKAKLIFPNVDIIEYLAPESNPGDPDHPHIPLLDFSTFENPDQTPQLKLVLTSSTTNSEESKAFLYIEKCKCELDLSIVDRVADLLEPRPFFDLPSYKRSRLDSIVRKDAPQLREDLFSVPLVVEQPSRLMVTVKCQAIDVNLRVPVADLRNPNGARMPYRQRHVHPEYIGLHLNSVTMEAPFGGESILFELFATEIYGSFCGISDKFTCSDEDRRFLWGGQTSVDESVHMKIEYDPRNKALKASGTKIHGVGLLGDDMTKSISLSLLQSLPHREGPFAQTHRSFLHDHEEGNDLILAGSREEMSAFGANCILQSTLVISLDVPILRLFIPSHSYLEVLYNRLVNDLLLWEPAAPSVRPGGDDFKINALSDDMFHECGGDTVDNYDDDCEEERFSSTTMSNGYDKNKSHALSLLLNVKKGTMLMCTNEDVLLAVAVRNTCLQLRPFRQSKDTWMFQLANLFTLQDYPIPGYELPVVTTDLHIHLDNVVLAYDHVWTNPESDIRLRLVLGESDISSSIIQDMSAVKVVSIFEGARLFMSNVKKSKDNVRFEEQRPAPHTTKSAPVKKKFFKVVDVGLFQLEFLSSLVVVGEEGSVTAPIVEIRCRNDIIKAWVCVDSLVALLNVASDIAMSGKFAPVDTSACPSERQSVDSLDEKPRFESGTPLPSSTQDVAASVPKPIEMKIKQMVESAMQEISSSASPASSTGIPCGADALEEFSPNFSATQSATGEPNIKYIGSRSDRSTTNSGITIDPQHFRVPSDWRGDGLAALPADFPPPIARYLLRDISICVHLYGGSDLSDEPPKERSYSTPEYREGKGKNQVVPPEAMGGKHRDHSVCVVLDLNKVLIQRRNNPEEHVPQCWPFVWLNLTMSNFFIVVQISMLPIKFNIDQDTMEFLDDFFQEVRTRVEFPSDVPIVTAARPVLEVPATIRMGRHSSSVDDYPELDKDSLNLRVLTPEAAPSSPLYDLSYLENRTKSASPAKKCHMGAPLTESAVSIGDLFGSKSRTSSRSTHDRSAQGLYPDIREANSPAFACADPCPEEDTIRVDDLQLAGDWSTDSQIRFPDLSQVEPISSADQMLMGASMHDSFHPDMLLADLSMPKQSIDVCDELLDTSDDLADCSNDLDKSTIGDDETSTQMAFSSGERQGGADAEFIFSPAVSVYVDYHGKNKINVEKNGAVLGVLSGIGQLNRTEFVLKEIVNRNGLLGVGRCIGVAVDEWVSDLRSSLPNVLASCSPISPFVQIGKGVVDLFWLPVAELRKEDGHVVKGIQKGVGSFGLSSAAGVVGMAQTVVGVIQMHLCNRLAYLFSGLRNQLRPDVYQDERHKWKNDEVPGGSGQY